MTIKKMHQETPKKKFINTFLKNKGLFLKEKIFFTVQADGSSRIFQRLVIPDSEYNFIIMENTPSNEYIERENYAYLMIGNHLFSKGLPVPEIHFYDLKNGWFILEDMGDRNLQDEISRTKDPIILYEKVLDLLFQLQFDGASGFNPDWCCQSRYYDRNLMRRYESDYFRDSFLSNYLGLNNTWVELERPFNHLALMASRAKNEYFLHRDFQSRNVMITNEKIGILDWQGGRLGPLGYDLASLMVDPYPDNTFNDREKIYHVYLQMLKEHRSELTENFETYFPYLSIQRNLQILGAFSFLAKVQKKLFFASYIAPALESLQELLARIEDQELSPLKDVIDKILHKGNK